MSLNRAASYLTTYPLPSREHEGTQPYIPVSDIVRWHYTVTIATTSDIYFGHAAIVEGVAQEGEEQTHLEIYLYEVMLNIDLVQPPTLESKTVIEHKDIWL